MAGKLVRNKIPQIIRQQTGVPAKWRELKSGTHEYRLALLEKLTEEAEEVFDAYVKAAKRRNATHDSIVADVAKELIDVLEVFYECRREFNLTPSELAQLRLFKRDRRGSFSQHMYIEE